MVAVTTYWWKWKKIPKTTCNNGPYSIVVVASYGITYRDYGENYSSLKQASSPRTKGLLIEVHWSPGVTQ
jgi:hypothetical protein